MKIDEFTDEQCIELLQDLLSTRVKLGTGYVQDPDTGILIYQFIVLTCGEHRFQSAHEPLAVPLIPVVFDKNVTVN